MGDCNFDSKFEEEFIPEEYSDIWKQLKNNDPGFTMPKTR
jgi:hypothetical protein